MFLERDEMKFAILYTLKRYTEPITMSVLSEILAWEKNVMGYFDLAVLMEELTEDEYIEEKFYRGKKCYCLSDRGADTNEYFFERVPKSIRRKIEETVGSIKFTEQADPNAVSAEIIPVASQQYMASLQMLDAGTPLLELKIFAGSKAEAEKAAGILKRQASLIYDNIVEIINTTDKK